MYSRGVRGGGWRGGGRGGRERGGGRFHGTGRGFRPPGGGGGIGGGGRRNNNRGPLQYDASKFDPIEEIGSVDPSKPTVRIAVEGCCHGELDLVYQRLQDHERTTGNKIDLLLCCGDFQSHRNPADFHSSSIPPKYRSLGTFPSYYSGEKKVPILTIFIGGNHEASQPLRELYYGGWVAPNIYYLGAAGVVRFAGLRIGGLSGIYKSHDYGMGHFERVPYDRSSLRSVYHVRNVDVLRMKCLSIGKNNIDNTNDNTTYWHRPMDIMLSHDWPLGIEQHGNTNDLLRRKPYFRQEVAENNLGSPPNREVLDIVRPKHWFSAHLHVKFKATVRFSANENTATETTQHSSDDFMSLIPSQVTDRTPKDDTEKESDKKTTNTTNEEATDTNMNQNAVSSTTEFHGLESSNCKSGDNSMEGLTEQMTRFLALDKCLPRRQFLSVLNLEAAKAPTVSNANKTQQATSSRYRLEYDPEWLAIVRKTHGLTCTQRRRVEVPQNPNEVISADELKAETEWVVLRLKDRVTDGSDGLKIPEDFVPTVPFASNPAFQGRGMCHPLPMMGNPITDNLLDVLQLEHVLTQPYDPTLTSNKLSSMLRSGAAPTTFDDNEIDLDVDENELKPPAEDSNEIDLDNGEDDVEDEDEIDINDEVHGDNETESNKKARLAESAER